MANVSRPNNYTPNSTILSSEVNDDFDTLYSEFNGNISAANLADNAVTTAKITNSNVTADKLADGAVTADKLQADVAKGWFDLADVPDTVTYNGNRSYDLVFNSNDLTDTVSNGMRTKFTRTVTPPTQCTDLESGSSQYWSKTSPAGTTFTDDFCTGAWIKPESYTSGGIISRYNGTSGWFMYMLADGRIQLQGNNAGAGNSSYVTSYQSVPLGKWTHVAAQLDMSTFTATTTTSYIMIDGINVPCSVGRAGTNPTALVQAGNLEVGSLNAGSFFDGKIAQAWYSSAKITQATIQSYISQGMTGSETSIVSHYDFNGDGNDNNANANNLTAQASAGFVTDSPFNATEYGIITANAFSTNTTLTVQVPEGYAIPTSGGVSAVAYSTQDVPYLFPRDKNLWEVESLYRIQATTTSNVTFGSYNGGGDALTIPIGNWDFITQLPMYSSSTTVVEFALATSSISGQAAGTQEPLLTYRVISPAASTVYTSATRLIPLSLTSATTYTLWSIGATTSAGMDSDNQLHQFKAILSYV